MLINLIGTRDSERQALIRRYQGYLETGDHANAYGFLTTLEGEFKRHGGTTDQHKELVTWLKQQKSKLTITPQQKLEIEELEKKRMATIEVSAK